MNSKIVLAFVGGLIVASGVTYIALKRNAPETAETAEVRTVVPTKAATAPATAAPIEAKQEPVPEARPEAVKPEPATRTRFARAPRPQLQPRPLKSASAPVAMPAPSKPAPAPAPEPVREVAKLETPPAPQPPPYEPPPPPPPPKPNVVTIPSGTTLSIRLGETLTTERNQPGDQFSGALDQPLVVGGFVLAERGARVQGRIVELERSGKVRGVARMAVELTHLKTSDGQNIRIRTSAFDKQAETTREKDAAKVGGGAALGAIIGAIAGGGKGAAIGAGAGGAAGAGDVVLTRGKPAELRVETRLAFRLSEAVTVTERLQ